MKIKMSLAKKILGFAGAIIIGVTTAGATENKTQINPQVIERLKEGGKATSKDYVPVEKIIELLNSKSVREEIKKYKALSDVFKWDLIEGEIPELTKKGRCLIGPINPLGILLGKNFIRITFKGMLDKDNNIILNDKDVTSIEYADMDHDNIIDEYTIHRKPSRCGFALSEEKYFDIRTEKEWTEKLVWDLKRELDYVPDYKLFKYMDSHFQKKVNGDYEGLLEFSLLNEDFDIWNRGVLSNNACVQTNDRGTLTDQIYDEKTKAAIKDYVSRDKLKLILKSDILKKDFEKYKNYRDLGPLDLEEVPELSEQEKCRLNIYSPGIDYGLNFIQISFMGSLDKDKNIIENNDVLTSIEYRFDDDGSLQVEDYTIAHLYLKKDKPCWSDGEVLSIHSKEDWKRVLKIHQEDNRPIDYTTSKIMDESLQEIMNKDIAWLFRYVRFGGKMTWDIR